MVRTLFFELKLKKIMKKQITYLFIYLIFLTTLQGQIVQDRLPGAEEISNRRTSFNLDEIKVRWKKAALENCTGVPCVVAPSFTCGTSTVSDIDGNAYNTVLIGTQCWTTSNLKVTKYNDGTAILLDASGGSDGVTGGENWSTQLQGAYTVYGNTPTNATNYGYLYNWYAVSDLRKLCPTGWHVPTSGEWNALASQLGGLTAAGGKLKSMGTTFWNSPNTGADNSSGFSGLGGGLRLGDHTTPSFSTSYLGPPGTFVYVKDRGYFWSATSSSTLGRAYARILNASNLSLNEDSFSRLAEGQSVRCLKD